MSTITPTIAGPMDIELPVPHVSQDATYWCWAACAQMVAYYYNKSANLYQSRIAETFYTGYDCCNAGRPYCNNPLQAQNIPKLYNSIGRTVKELPNPLASADVAGVLRGGPIQLYLDLGNGAYHFVLLVGTSNAASSYLINDPASPNSKSEMPWQQVTGECRQSWSIT